MRSFKSCGGVWFRRVPPCWEGPDWFRTDLPLTMLTDSNIQLAVLWLEGSGRGVAIRTADLIRGFELEMSRPNNIVPFTMKFEQNGSVGTIDMHTIPIFWW
jgi:hypothetical protein